ncbi:hypothetical protein PoB_007627500 [Plakobranchus ocellatus]|uniref:Uncharacterized protein n=1 Tax=Plakobranchus ocellatus TaxID=259542 RepID=A0AAV4E0A5_9GAST|nr:hypothetical protein PoB_007627500 [Plakobranchus ocellatus]
MVDMVGTVGTVNMVDMLDMMRIVGPDRRTQQCRTRSPALPWLIPVCRTSRMIAYVCFRQGAKEDRYDLDEVLV